MLDQLDRGIDLKPETVTCGNYFPEWLARHLWFEESNISVNVLSPVGRVKTPGNLFLGNNPEDPYLDFEVADALARATVWLCEQPASFTGQVLWDEEVCEQHGL